MLKILQNRLQRYVNWELLDVQARFRKRRGTRDQIANICWIVRKSQRISEKRVLLPSLTTLKPLTVWGSTSLGWKWHHERWTVGSPWLCHSFERCVSVAEGAGAERSPPAAEPGQVGRSTSATVWGQLPAGGDHVSPLAFLPLRPEGILVWLSVCICRWTWSESWNTKMSFWLTVWKERQTR